jgi:hypothetical protein
MIWPDGVTYNSDGFMYSGAAQLIQTGPSEQRNSVRQGEQCTSVPDLSVPPGSRGYTGFLMCRPEGEHDGPCIWMTSACSFVSRKRCR